MNILIVEDSIAYGRYVSLLLQKMGHDTFHFFNGLEACEILRKENKIALILLDWNMPVMNGPDFLDAVKREKLSEAPIIMMTTENSPSSISIALKKGVSEYIIKPFTDDILFSKINSVTGGDAIWHG